MSTVAQVVQYLNHGVRVLNSTPIKFTGNGNTETTEVNRTYPLARLRCRCSGSLNVAAGGITLKSGGVTNIIDRLNLRLDGATNIVDLPGKLLRHVHQVYNKCKPVINQPTLTENAARAFDFTFDLPINAKFTDSPYFSLLDATDEAGHNALTVYAPWTDPSKIAATGTCTINNTTQLEVNAVEIAGGAKGMPGGIGYGYPIHLLETQTYVISGAQSDFPLRLNRGSAYQRIILYFEASGSPSDSILNSATLRLGSTTYKPSVTAAMLKHDNKSRYQIADADLTAGDWTGVYVFDVNEDDMANQMEQSIDSTPFELLLNVSGAASLTVIMDRFVYPTIRK